MSYEDEFGQWVKTYWCPVLGDHTDANEHLCEDCKECLCAQDL